MCPLSSGSSGNSTFISSKKTKLLFDVGLSYKKLREKLSEIDLCIENIDGIVISHEHSDHIKAIEQISKKHPSIPFLCNGDTAKAIVDYTGLHPNFQIFSSQEGFRFGDIDITPFSIQHDTLDPVAFALCFDGIKVGICTDLGFASNLVAHHLIDCDYLLLEANHEESMVHSCARPMIYKKRVLGRQGHLSNQDCASLLQKLLETSKKPLKHVYLAHLSSECNTKEVALKTVSEHLAKHGIMVDLSIAHQEKVSKYLQLA